MNSLSTGPSIGKHLLVNVYDVPTSGILEYMTQGLPLLHQMVHDLRLSIMSQTGHQFPPVGYSYSYLLSESHMTIHTYPEYNACFVDLFTCGQNCSAEKFDAALREYLQPKQINSQIQVRK